ncbi:MAG: hypothetical protein NE328_00335, partial [Lentisphaeraceae bacterium]|nr:hypothetical protein [Lentisphaeraceae bacterium]
MRIIIIATTLLTCCTFNLPAEDKAFERKDISDTQKKLEIRKSSLTDTKKLLRKTDTLSKSQIKTLKANTLKSIGKEAYIYAARNTPNLLQTRLKYLWLKMQLENQKGDWHRREKRDAARSGGKLTKNRANDYEKKYSKVDEKINIYNSAIKKLDSKMIQISKKVID